MLTHGDEYPIHQTPEPIAFSGTDRNFYDRYFFNGYRQDGSGFFAIAFGVYPHLNIADAHVSILAPDGRQLCLHASRGLEMERMALEVGPIRIEVIEPLKRLRIVVDGEGVSADLTCTGRAFPVQEPRFTRRVGPRLLMDLTRFTQCVRWEGHISFDGQRQDYSSTDCMGVRDRSWGVRPIGAADAQPMVPPLLPQFYWLWAPTNFPNLGLYFHVNEDEAGRAWNQRASLVMDGAAHGAEIALTDPKMKLTFTKGTRHATAAALTVTDPSGRPHQVTWQEVARFQMKGIGYGHPDWSHGVFKGALAVEREAFVPAELDPLVPANLHIQSVALARHEGPEGLASSGVGAFEQLVLGPHAPSGLSQILDGAA